MKTVFLDTLEAFVATYSFLQVNSDIRGNEFNFFYFLKDFAVISLKVGNWVTRVRSICLTGLI